jgi:hypothetical protein
MAHVNTLWRRTRSKRVLITWVPGVPGVSPRGWQRELPKIAVGAWLLWILVFPTHPWSKHISNVGLTSMPLVAAGQCARHARGVAGRLRRVWLLMGGSCLAWGLGMAVWTGYESIGGRDRPFPLATGLGYLATVSLAVAALLIFPTRPQRAAARARTVVDGLVIGASLLIVSWNLASVSGNRIAVGWFLGYLLIFVAARQVSSRHGAARMEPPLSSHPVVTYGAVGLAGITTVGALLRDGVDPFVFWIGLFLVVAYAARHVLTVVERTAREKSLDAWVQVGRDSLEDWIPITGNGRRN